MEINNTNKYIPYIDGCRAIAILIVVLSHGGLGKLIPGKFGVTLFFFISGYLITKLLLAELDKTGHVRLKDFYLRRFFRLYPALLGMILVSLLAGKLLHCSIPGKDVFAALFYYTNYYIGWIRPPVDDCLRILDILWSLSVEEHFYLFFPFLALLFLKRNARTRRSYFLFILLGLCLLALLFRVIIYLQYGQDISEVSGKVYFSTHTRMDSILWGCMAAVWLYGIHSRKYIGILQNSYWQMAGCLLLLLSVAIRSEVFRETLIFTFQGLGLFLLIPALGFYQHGVVKRSLESPLLLFIGKISYSLYLFHWVALKTANAVAPEFSLRWHFIFWPLTLVLALSSYFLIEKPFVSLRRKFGSHTQQ